VPPFSRSSGCWVWFAFGEPLPTRAGGRGLDIDALQTVARGVNRFHDPNNSVLLITHYQRLLNYIEPDFIHVLSHGRIIRTGGKELALELEAKGYTWLTESDG